MRRSIAAAALTVALLSFTGAIASAGPPPFTFSVYLYSTCIGAYGPANVDVTVTQKSGTGVLKGSVVSHSSAGGYLSACFPHGVRPGDVLRASQGGNHSSVTVPVMTAAADRDTDVASGTAPANSHVTVSLSHCEGEYVCTNVGSSRVRPTNSSGAWTTDFTSLVDVKGHDYAFVAWTDASGDSFYIYDYFPWFRVTIGSFEVNGSVAATSSATLTLKSSSGSTRGTAHVTGDLYEGSYYGQFAKSGVAVDAKVGDKVVAPFTPASGVKLKPYSASATASNDHVAGTCAANSGVEVYVYDPTFPYRTQSYSYTGVVADGSGHFTADTSNVNYPTFDLQTGDLVTVYCALSSGDEEAIQLLVP